MGDEEVQLTQLTKDGNLFFKLPGKVLQAELDRGDFGSLAGLTAGTVKYRLAEKSMKVKMLRRVEQLVEARSFSAEAREKAREFALLATFNNDPYGVVGLLAGVVGQVNSALPIAKPLMPFPKTFSNLVNASLNYSPVGLLRAQNWTAARAIASHSQGRVQQLAKDVDRRFEKFSAEYYSMQTRAAIGTAFMTAIAGAVWATIQAIKNAPPGEEPKDLPLDVTASGHSDFQINRQMREAGTRPLDYSIRIGGGHLPYRDWPAINLVLGAAGGAIDAFRYNGVSDKDAMDQFSLASMASVSAITSKQMLQGFSNLFTALANPDTRGANALENLAGSTIGGFTHPTALRAVETSFVQNANGKVELPDKSTFNGWLYSLTPLAALPVVGNKRKLLNGLGEPIELLPWETIANRFISWGDTVKPHPIYTPLVRAGLFLPVASKAQKIGVDIDNPKGRTMTNEQFYDYARVYGQSLKAQLDEKTVQQLVNDAQSGEDGRQAAQDALESMGRMATADAKDYIEQVLTAKPK